MNNPKYSIIIPVYNAEKYLGRCLDSVVNQSFKAFEVILVDDGSTDSSREICETKSKNNTRIHYYYQNNQGVSTARNKGIKEAEGQYILFVDADDYISHDLLQNVDTCNTGEDVIFFQFTVENNGKMLKIKQDLSKFVNTPLDFTMFYKKSEGTTDGDVFLDKSMAVYCWRAMYRKQFLADSRIQFNQTLKAGEDRIFLYDVLLAQPKVKTVDDEYGYFHTVHGTDSITGSKDLQQYNPTLFYDQLNMYEAEMRAIEQNKNLQTSDIESIKQFRANSIRTSVIINEFKYNGENARKNVLSYYQNDLFRYAYGFKSLKEVLKRRNIKEIVLFLLVRMRWYRFLSKIYRR